MPPAFSFFLAIQDLLCFHTEFRDFSSLKVAIGILRGIALNL